MPQRLPGTHTQIKFVKTRFNIIVLPIKCRFLYDALSDASRTPYGYIVLDLHPETPEILRTRNFFYPDPENDNLKIYYVPNS